MSDDRLRLTIATQREWRAEALMRLRKHSAAVKHYRLTAGHRAPDWLTQLTAKVSGLLAREVGFHEGAIAAFKRMEREWHG